jgi:DNA polymerase-3 subunit alpha
MRFSSEEFYFRSPQEMERLFREIPAAVRNTFEIAQRCGLTLEVGTGKAHLPTFPLPAGYDDPNRYLRELAEAGLREQYDRITPELESRLARELDIIQRMEYAGYFLIVKDFIDFAREKGIAVGPGRGSAVGSLVCYALRITDVDPLKYGLLFERFMNLERVSMPDIDIDFGDRRRDEIIEHVINKYGQENVTQIITFGTLMSRAAVRDVGRAMGIPYQDVDRLAKAIPYGKSLAEAREVAEFKEAVTGNESFEALVAVAGQIEGLLRHAGTHAAGVVITPGPLTDYLPLYRGTNDVVSTQYAMESLEDIGLLKMDFLGLRTLTVIQETERMLKERGIDLDVGHVPLDDLPTFELLRQGDTVGVFQLESSGMRELLRRLGPDSISDLIALVALYRPGPMRMTEEFVERKHGRRKVEYAHPLLEKVLKETYGVGVYQEQVMEVSSALAGFPLGKADKIRRAMAKKKPEEMERIREDFIAGAVKNKVAEPVAQKVFQLVAEFAGYGFNKSHAAAYAILSYRTAYLKAHYPREFMAATLSSEMGDTDRIIVLLSECREMDLNVLPPDVNESTRDFQVVPEGIRFGLGAVKNVGEGAIRELLQARSKLGRIATLTQLAGAVDTRTCNRKVLESLIKAGALDSLDTPGSSSAEKRAALLAMLEKVLQDVSARKRRQMLNQTSLFETETSPGPLPSSSPSETPDSRNLLSDEKEALGFYLSGHPLESFREELRAMRVTGISELEKKRDNEPVVLGGVISAVRRTRDRNGREMGFVTLDDFEGSVEVTMFADVFVSYRGLILKNSPVLIQGKVSTREGERPKVLATELVTFETCRDEFIRGLHLELSEEWPESTLMSLKDALKEHPGICSVYLHVRDRNGTPGIHSTKLRVNPSSALMERLRRIAGTTNVYLEGMWRRDSPRHPGPPRG